MATVADIAKWVRTAVPGCPEPILLDALKRAAEDYCTRAKVVFKSVSVETQVGVRAYDLTLDDGFGVVQIEKASRDDSSDSTALEPSSKQDIDQSPSESGRPRLYYLNNLGQIVLYPTPESEGLIDVEVQAAPTELSVHLPDELMQLNRYTAVAQGAKAILFGMENVPWSDMTKAALAQAMFNQAIDAEHLKLAKGGTQKRLRTTPIFF